MMMGSAFGDFGMPMMMPQMTQQVGIIERPTVFRMVIINGQQAEEEHKEPVPTDLIDKLEKTESVEECPVCQESGGKGLKLPCNHSFHEGCIKPWLQNKNTCPCCRHPLTH